MDDQNSMDNSLLNALNFGGQEGSVDRHTNASAHQVMLQTNLAALRLHSPLAAKQIEEGGTNTPSQLGMMSGEFGLDGRVRFVETDEGVLSAELDGVALASKRKPMHEAQRLAEKLDPAQVACCAVLGFGMGYHCGTLLERLGTTGVVVCFEPDLEMLKAVLGRVDYSKMFATGRFFLVTGADDPATVGRIFTGIEAVVGLGVEIISHPPSKKRLGTSGDVFGKVFSDTLGSVRTHLVTTLANARISFRNAMMNLDHYTTSAGVELLKDSCKGKPAIVVSAGPSLSRNLDLLCDPKVRDSVVVIAVQTVLKTLLAKGIKPEFVAALDYHEISTRFYEGITAEDVEGVRLIVEAKANPAILDAFPGEVLCVSDELLDRLLGDSLKREMGNLSMGGTVAHLCYYFARYLGCDPVIFIGQDLGFTDGQYYAAGAAIHQVWGGELNAHNTLEMMEWQRIARMKTLLRKKTDIYGRDIYADEQMSTYLAQFEAEFQKDEEHGRTVIDASEGGVRKNHTTVMTLKEAIEAHGVVGGIDVPTTIQDRVENDENSQQRMCARLDAVIKDAKLISYLSDESVKLLDAMIEHHTDRKRVNKLIVEVQAIGERVVKLKPAFELAQAVNQVGVLNRMKRDRAIEMDSEASGLDRQQMQIQRDITNVQWTSEAAMLVVEMLERTKNAYLGLSEKQTNDINEAHNKETESEVVDEIDTDRVRLNIHAVVMADPEFGGLGTKRDLGAQLTNDRNVIQTTIARLGCAEQLDAITIMTPEPDAIRSILGSMLSDGSINKPITVVGVDAKRFRERGARVGSSRMQSSECWRGSIGMLGVYDEQVEPVLLSQVMRTHKIDGCAIVGADWAMIDPGLVDQTVARFRNQDTEKRIAFSQAVPGLGTMVVDRETIGMIASSIESAQGGKENHFATLGALVGYLPMSPQFDSIAKGVCVEVEPTVRDAGLRIIADSESRIVAMREAYQDMGSADEERINSGGISCVQSFGESSRRQRQVCPRTIVLETCTGRFASGEWGSWKRHSMEPIERQVMSMSDAHKLFQEISSLREDVAVVFDGVGDPLMHSDAMGLVQLAKEDGIVCVELRTDLLREGVDACELLESGVDILSVDLISEYPEVYAELSGIDRLGDVYSRIQSIFDAMSGQARSMWFVARITRCDATCEEIEQFFDKWLMLCGSAVIDPLPGDVTSQRISKLPIPKARQQQMDLSTMYIQSDGEVVDSSEKPICGGGVNVFDMGIERAYQLMCSAMRSSQIEPKACVSVAAEENAA
ncbi:MAG: DUF115 domain-containing protein [Phycisphaerales bacterium]|nr:DUF115 domain-containing protein [Phycisphaerales bacterium]